MKKKWKKVDDNSS